MKRQNIFLLIYASGAFIIALALGTSQYRGQTPIRLQGRLEARDVAGIRAAVSRYRWGRAREQLRHRWFKPLFEDVLPEIVACRIDEIGLLSATNEVLLGWESAKTNKWASAAAHNWSHWKRIEYDLEYTNRWEVRQIWYE